MDAPQKFVWRYWTNVSNWDDPPTKFALDGPFAVGSRLTTILPGQTWHSIIRSRKAWCRHRTSIPACCSLAVLADSSPSLVAPSL